MFLFVTMNVVLWRDFSKQKGRHFCGVYLLDFCLNQHRITISTFVSFLYVIWVCKGVEALRSILPKHQTKRKVLPFLNYHWFCFKTRANDLVEFIVGFMSHNKISSL